MLRWKRWSRVVMLVAAWLIVGVSVLSSVAYSIISAAQISATRATTQWTGPPMWFYMWTSLVQWIPYSAFPVIVIWVMLQREVANLWASDSTRAFEVLPVADRAAGGTP